MKMAMCFAAIVENDSLIKTRDSKETREAEKAIKYSFNFPYNCFRRINCAICNRLYK